MNKKTIITAMLALDWVARQGQSINWKIEGTDMKLAEIFDK